MATLNPNEQANFSPEMGSYSGVKKFRAWVQMVLPQIYDDALSYQELVYKMLWYLNTLIDDVDTAETNIDSLKEAYNTLESYVNDYFDVLDVQEEIDNKLDAMAEDGTLTELVKPFIVSTTEEWLEEHITQETGYVIDTSFSVSGAAADAAAVGKRMVRYSEISSANEEYLTFGDFHQNTFYLVRSAHLTTMSLPSTCEYTNNPLEFNHINIAPLNMINYYTGQSISDDGVDNGLLITTSDSGVGYMWIYLAVSDLLYEFHLGTNERQVIPEYRVLLTSDTVSTFGQLRTNTYYLITNAALTGFELPSVCHCKTDPRDVNHLCVAPQTLNPAWQDGRWDDTEVDNCLIMTCTQDNVAYMWVYFTVSDILWEIRLFDDNQVLARYRYLDNADTVTGFGKLRCNSYYLIMSGALSNFELPSICYLTHDPRDFNHVCATPGTLNIDYDTLRMEDTEVDNVVFLTTTQNSVGYLWIYFGVTDMLCEINLTPNSRQVTPEYRYLGTADTVTNLGLLRCNTYYLIASAAIKGMTMPQYCYCKHLPSEFTHVCVAPQTLNPDYDGLRANETEVDNMYILSCTENNVAYEWHYYAVADILVECDYFSSSNFAPRNSYKVFKKVACIGDSYTAGTVYLNSGWYTDSAYSWPTYLANNSGAEYINLGYTGVGAYNYAEEHYTDIASAGTVQCYLIGLGINDMDNGIEIGDASTSTDNDGTYVGGLKFVYTFCRAASPDAKIFFMTIGSNTNYASIVEDYNDAVRNLVTSLNDDGSDSNVFLIDLYKYAASFDKLTYVQYHPTASSYEQMAEIFEYAWSQVIDDNQANLLDIPTTTYH